MTRTSKLRAHPPLAAAALALAIVLGPVPLARGSAEDAAEEKPEPKVAPAPESPGANVVDAGVLHNTAHGIRFPVPKGFELKATSTADEIVLTVADCEECILRVLVSPGNTDSLDTTIRAIKQQVATDPTARILDEQRTRVARESAYTLVKEEVPDGKGASRIMTRYVTFNHREDKYYFVLREPSARFSADEDAFEKLLSKLRFDS